ncbi:MAG: aminoglycoside phosphotransferase [Rhodocyclaceae bacterium]|nr:aminoglycoside phosphotransferase [Rhodocyclaceae bacterium]
MSSTDPLAEQRRLVQALLDPARYPHPVAAVSLIETHISFLLLTGRYAYKIKKAVDLGFVDYLGLERRRHFCHEELRLNRRLAPELYLEVAAIGGAPEDPRWDAGGEAIEYAVKMAQFPQADLLDQVLARGGLTPSHVDALAARVAAFHRAAPSATPSDEYGSPAAVWSPAEANFAHLQRLGAAARWPRLADLEAWSRAEYQRLGPTLAQRRAAGFVRECHGDLHLGNMVLLDGTPAVFDCIEFNPSLRWIDVANDLAFLAMDLSERGRPDYAWRLLNDWLEELGDYAGLPLLRFYQVYRALVRAKVACIRAADPALPAPERQAALAAADGYVDYALSIIAPRPGALVITHGLSGSGKSTAARAVAESLGGVRLRSDVERKRLHGLGSLARSGSGIADGLYGDGATAATYARLAELAGAINAAGYPAVIDAACLRRWQRQRFQDLARTRGIPLVIIDCRAPESVLLERLAARDRRGDDASEATPAVLAEQLAQAEPLTPDEREAAVVVDTAGDGLARALAEIRRRIFEADGRQDPRQSPEEERVGLP